MVESKLLQDSADYPAAVLSASEAVEIFKSTAGAKTEDMVLAYNHAIRNTPPAWKTAEEFYIGWGGLKKRLRPSNVFKTSVPVIWGRATSMFCAPKSTWGLWPCSIRIISALYLFSEN